MEASGKVDATPVSLLSGPSNGGDDPNVPLGEVVGWRRGSRRRIAHGASRCLEHNDPPPDYQRSSLVHPAACRHVVAASQCSDDVSRLVRPKSRSCRGTERLATGPTITQLPWANDAAGGTAPITWSRLTTTALFGPPRSYRRELAGSCGWPAKAQPLQTQILHPG